MERKLRVLLVDDSLMLVEITRAFLRQQGFDVRAATTIAEFERILGDWQPQVVLTDVRMPETSGADLCRLLKTRVNRLVPVLLFSSLPEVELARLAGQCGADGFVSKVHGLGGLQRQLEEVCESILW